MNRLLYETGTTIVLVIKNMSEVELFILEMFTLNCLTCHVYL